MEQQTIDKLIEHSGIFEHHDIRLEDGYFRGVAYSQLFQGGYTAAFSISSYEFDEDEPLNHVPNVVVLDPSGAITAEPHADDSQTHRKALRNAVQTTEWVYENWVASEPPEQ